MHNESFGHIRHCQFNFFSRLENKIKKFFYLRVWQKTYRGCVPWQVLSWGRVDRYWITKLTYLSHPHIACDLIWPKPQTDFSAFSSCHAIAFLKSLSVQSLRFMDVFFANAHVLGLKSERTLIGDDARGVPGWCRGQLSLCLFTFCPFLIIFTKPLVLIFLTFLYDNACFTFCLR